MQAATASANAPGTASSTSSIGDAAVGDRSPSPRQNVGDVRQAEDRLDALIESLSWRGVRARAAGRHAEARDLAQQMNEAIGQRTPEHQARLQRHAIERSQRWLAEQWQRDLETLQRIERQMGGDVDFFGSMGEITSRRCA